MYLNKVLIPCVFQRIYFETLIIKKILAKRLDNGGGLNNLIVMYRFIKEHILQQHIFLVRLFFITM